MEHGSRRSGEEPDEYDGRVHGDVQEVSARHSISREKILYKAAEVSNCGSELSMLKPHTSD